MGCRTVCEVRHRASWARCVPRGASVSGPRDSFAFLAKTVQNRPKTRVTSPNLPSGSLTSALTVLCLNEHLSAQRNVRLDKEREIEPHLPASASMIAYEWKQRRASLRDRVSAFFPTSCCSRKNSHRDPFRVVIMVQATDTGAGEDAMCVQLRNTLERRRRRRSVGHAVAPAGEREGLQVGPRRQACRQHPRHPDGRGHPGARAAAVHGGGSACRSQLTPAREAILKLKDRFAYRPHAAAARAT